MKTNLCGLFAILSFGTFGILTTIFSSCAHNTSLHHQSFYAKSLGVDKKFSLYLPKGYSGNEKRYPVINLLHGLGVTETAWVEMGIEKIADDLQLEAIIAMPDGNRGYYTNSPTIPDYEVCLKEKNPQKNPKEKREDFCVRKASYEDYISISIKHFGLFLSEKQGP